MDITIEEWELTSFFEVEPEKLDEDVIWFYNFNTYKILKGEIEFICSIEPCSNDIHISMRRNKEIQYELNARNVEDIRLLKENRSEMLEIIINPQDRILLKVKPEIVILHEVENGP